MLPADEDPVDDDFESDEDDDFESDDAFESDDDEVPDDFADDAGLLLEDEPRLSLR